MQIETDASLIQGSATSSAGRIRDLRGRIARLKLKFTENEVKVQQATDAANSAQELADRAEKVLSLICSYIIVFICHRHGHRIIMHFVQQSDILPHLCTSGSGIK